jgi:hypothetical protein
MGVRHPVCSSCKHYKDGAMIDAVIVIDETLTFIMTERVLEPS